jgi:hypothetical protein
MNYGSGGWGFDSLRARQFAKFGALSSLKAVGTTRLQLNARRAAALLLCAQMILLCLSGCTSSAPANPNLGSKVRTGFIDKLADELTTRECNVIRFTCPYGFGPAGEPCECTDPSGIVLNGRTIK